MVFAGLQGANRSRRKRYGEDLQRRRTQKSMDANGAGGFAELPKVCAARSGRIFWKK